MAGEQAQQQQISPEMLKKMQQQSEEKKVKTNSSVGGTGSRHWIVKFGKDFAYLGFPHIILLKEFIKWIFDNRNKNQTLNQLANIIKTDNNSTNTNNNVLNDEGKISFEEVDSPPVDIPSLAEAAPELDNLVKGAATQFQNRNQWEQNVAASCDNEESSLLLSPGSRKKTGPSIT